MLFKQIPRFTFPKIIRIKQSFIEKKITSLSSEIIVQMRQIDSLRKVKDKSIAIAVGSRGISNLQIILKTIIEQLTIMGARPFVVPAMGSHGGGIAKNQEQILSNYGISEKELGIPIKSSMEVINLGKIGKTQLPVYFDKQSFLSDGIILVNRIKPHTSMNADIGSGLLKMLVIGLGKHEGASSIHALGIHGLHETIIEAGNLLINKVPLLCSVGIVEDALGNTSVIEILESKNLFDREKELFLIAKKQMPKLPEIDIDLLIVNEIGKNYCGTGIDTQLVGRYAIWDLPNRNEHAIKKIAALNLSSQSEGNALGIGLADIITNKIYKSIDYETTVINAITGTFLQRAFIPIIVKNDCEAVNLGIFCSRRWDPNNARIIRIQNSLNLLELEVSEGAWQDIKEDKRLSIVNGPFSWTFNRGNFITF